MEDLKNNAIEDEVETVKIKDDELEALESENKEEEEKEPSYTTGTEKLKAEEAAILESVIPEYKDIMAKQFGMLFDVLVKKAEEDAGFNALVLQKHKSFKRAMKYAESKAKELRTPTDKEKQDARRGIPIVTPVSPEKVLEWIIDYYGVDDKKEYEEEMKRYAPHKPVVIPKSMTAPKTTTATPPKPKLKKGEMEGQMDFMSLLNM